MFIAQSIPGIPLHIHWKTSDWQTKKENKKHHDDIEMKRKAVKKRYEIKLNP